MSTRLKWGELLSCARLPKLASLDAQKPTSATWIIPSRTETERDFDRILFATPTRRLGDKTQVFPLDKNESVRTRLTHSHEVANLARSIGTYLVNSGLGERIVSEAAETLEKGSEAKVRRAIPAMLAAVGLAHDLGNPPFGHQGEEAIRGWVKNNDKLLFNVPDDLKQQDPVRAGRITLDLKKLTKAHKKDFLNFEGNAQTLRTLTRLQVVKDDRGLNLTFGTLSALMKYTVDSNSTDSKKDSPTFKKKVGFFQSEAKLVKTIRSNAGFGARLLRHPLTYLMEACDDIAYLIVDAEDAVKKQIVSFHDLMAWLDARCKNNDSLSLWVTDSAKAGAEEARVSELPPSELNDVSMQIFRANAITAMVSSVIKAFEERYDEIMTNGLSKPLIDLSDATDFAKAMKDFDKVHAYRHRRVLEVELDGFNTLQDLMDMLWRGISERESFEDPSSARASPFARYAYGRISVNYRRIFEKMLPSDVELPIRYREIQLLTDMVSGMTDQYAVDLTQELRRFHVGASARP